MISELREKDFMKQREALLSMIDDNMKIDKEVMGMLKENDFSLLEEHTELSKIIVQAVKELSDLYKHAPKEDSKPKKAISINDLKDLAERRKKTA